MTKSISFNPLEKLKKDTYKLGEATQSWKKISSTRVEAKALEGVDFKGLPQGREHLKLPFYEAAFNSETFNQVPAELAVNRNTKDHSKKLTSSQLALLKLIDQAAVSTGKNLEIEKAAVPRHKDAFVQLKLTPQHNFKEDMEPEFEKPLPSPDSPALSDLFRDKPKLEHVDKENKCTEN